MTMTKTLKKKLLEQKMLGKDFQNLENVVEGFAILGQMLTWVFFLGYVALVCRSVCLNQ